jgi:prepilin-type N-terminal cleavage/methylation domain-containing protein
VQKRRGVSLIEVLVASVLLAIGIAGTMQALLASARLRLEADRREAMVALLLDRLAWFEAEACAGGDTTGATQLADGPEAQWRVEAVGATRVLTLEGARARGRTVPRAHIVTSRPCP